MQLRPLGVHPAAPVAQALVAVGDRLHGLRVEARVERLAAPERLEEQAQLLVAQHGVPLEAHLAHLGALVHLEDQPDGHGVGALGYLRRLLHL